MAIKRRHAQQGRPRKFKINELVEFTDTEGNRMAGVIVLYRPKVPTHKYLIVRTDRQGRTPHLVPIWGDAPRMSSLGKFVKRPGRIYRANLKLGGNEMRGCTCHCCPHVRGVEDGRDEE